MNLASDQYLQDNLDFTLFSWSKQSGLHPIHAQRARGVYIYDQDDKRYIDFSSQLMNVNVGHGRPEVTEAVVQQMNQLSYVAPSFATDIRGRLGAKIASLMPDPLNKTFFTLGGAEAIDNAIKLARLVSGRHKIITHYRSYHGATIGAISAGGDPRKHLVDGQQVPNIVHVENPYAYRCPWYSESMEECGQRSLVNLEKIIRYEGPETIAAVLMEGESGSSGCIKYPPKYLQGVKRLCEHFGILFIADEVMSGFGRTGQWFGFNHHDITPDIVCMAKGLTSGYLPLGGITITNQIAERFDNSFLPLGLTYSAHPVSCAAALRVIQIYEDEALVQRAETMGSYLDERMKTLQNIHPSFGDWRNTGLLGCLELVKNKNTREPLVPWNAPASKLGIMHKIAVHIRDAGMFTFVKWNFIFVAPPLIITEDQIEEGLAIISGALDIADTVCV